MGAIKLNIPHDKQKHVEISTLCAVFLLCLCIFFELFAYHLLIPVLVYGAAIAWEFYWKKKKQKPFDLMDIFASTSVPMFLYVIFLIICTWSNLI